MLYTNIHIIYDVIRVDERFRYVLTSSKFSMFLGKNYKMSKNEIHRRFVEYIKSTSIIMIN